MTYRMDTPCLTSGCDGTPFFGETASPGYCDSCHVRRMEEAEARLAAIDAVLDAKTAGEHQAAQRAAVALFGGCESTDAWTAYLRARDERIEER